MARSSTSGRCALSVLGGRNADGLNFWEFFECADTRVGLSKGYPTTPIEKAVKPSHRKGIQSTRTKFVRSVIREVAGFAPYERRVMELLRNSKVRPFRSFCKCYCNPDFTVPRIRIRRLVSSPRSGYVLNKNQGYRSTLNLTETMI